MSFSEYQSGLIWSDLIKNKRSGSFRKEFTKAQSDHDKFFRICSQVKSHTLSFNNMNEHIAIFKYKLKVKRVILECNRKSEQFLKLENLLQRLLKIHDFRIYSCAEPIAAIVTGNRAVTQASCRKGYFLSSVSVHL